MIWIANVRQAARHALDHMKETETLRTLDRAFGSVTGALVASMALGVVTGVSLSKPSRAEADGEDDTTSLQPDERPVPLPTDKLSCKCIAPLPRTPTVLVSCGSFNPPTVAHMRMFDLASQALAQRGHDVWGGYMSPVNDGYGKQHLEPAQHRLAMCRLAAQESEDVMVDAWEAQQRGYVRTLNVLERIESQLQHMLDPEGQQAAAAASVHKPAAGAGAGAGAGASPAEGAVLHSAFEDAADDVGAILSCAFVPGAVPSDEDVQSALSSSSSSSQHRDQQQLHLHHHHHKQVTIIRHKPTKEEVAEDVGPILSVAFVPGAALGPVNSSSSSSSSSSSGPSTCSSSSSSAGSSSADSAAPAAAAAAAASSQGQQPEARQALQPHVHDQPQPLLPKQQHAQQGPPQQQGPPAVQVMLLCGEDLLESMARPGTWHRPDFILEHFGVVCVARNGGRARQLLQQPGSLLHSYRERILLVDDPVPNAISSSKVRRELAAGRPVRFLVPESVLRYIRQHGLYGCSPARLGLGASGA